MNEIERQMAIEPEGTVDDLVAIIRRMKNQLLEAQGALVDVKVLASNIAWHKGRADLALTVECIINRAEMA